MFMDLSHTLQKLLDDDDFYSAIAIAVMYYMSYDIGLCYNGTGVT